MNYFKHFLAVVACMLLVCGCKTKNSLPEVDDDTVIFNDHEQGDTVQVAFPAFYINFPDAINDTVAVAILAPAIRFEVHSEVGLASVSAFALKADGSAPALGNTVISFENEHLYERTITGSDVSLNDLTGIRVQANENGGSSARSEVRLRIVSKPILEFATDSFVVNINPLAPKPEPAYTVTASGLRKVSIYLVYSNGTESLHSEITTFPAGVYNGRITGVTYTENLIGLKVVAEDVNGGKAEGTIVLRCIEDTSVAPQVQFLQEEVIAIYGTVNPLIRLRVTSSIGLKKLSYFWIQQNNENNPIALNEVTTFADNKDYIGEVTGLTKTNFQYLVGVEVRAEDINGKTTTQRLNIPCLAAMDDNVNQLAFPGADGYAAATTTGGRGGTVVYVTNLNDNGTGSFRSAVSGSDRIIVFKVSGVIALNSALKITGNNLTIAGQTAPGDGICIKNFGVQVSSNNVIVRYMRFRMGDERNQESDALEGRNRSNIIIDHCSMSWSTDECSSFYDNTNFTMQWCYLSESLRMSAHAKGAHGYGGIWGGKGASFHHNLLAHHDSRNPRFCGSRYSNQPALEKCDMRNNVLYNWGGNSGYAGEGGKYNIVNNYYKPGAGTPSNVRTRIFSPNAQDTKASDAQAASGAVWGEFWLAGNYMNGSTAVTNDNWQGFQPNTNNGGYPGGSINNIKLTGEFSVPHRVTHTAQAAYERVLDYGGASYRRDAVDARVSNEVKNGLPASNRASNGTTRIGLIDSQNDVGGWPAYESLPALQDTDSDGMPDVWELANGLNPNDSSDGKTKTLSTTYTNVEVYLNSLVEHITKAQQN